MSEFSFDKYTNDVKRAEGRRRQGGRPPSTPRVPMLELPEGLEKSQTERPGPDTQIVLAEAGLVAAALLRKGVAFDRVLSVNHPEADTRLGAWDLNPTQDHSQYNLRSAGRPSDAFNRIHMEPAILGQGGQVLFSFHGLYHEPGSDASPEPLLGLRSLGEGSAESEQVRYGLASLVFTHDLDLRLERPSLA